MVEKLGRLQKNWEFSSNENCIPSGKKSLIAGAPPAFVKSLAFFFFSAFFAWNLLEKKEKRESAGISCLIFSCEHSSLSNRPKQGCSSSSSLCNPLRLFALLSPSFFISSQAGVLTSQMFLSWSKFPMKGQFLQIMHAGSLGLETV